MCFYYVQGGSFEVVEMYELFPTWIFVRNPVLVPEIDSTQRAEHVEHLIGKNGKVKYPQRKK